MTPESIKALAAFWPIILILFASFWLWYFRLPIKAFFEKATTFTVKRGQTEVIVTQPSAPSLQGGDLAPTGDKSAIPPVDMPSPTSKSSGSSEGQGLQRMFDAAARNNIEDLTKAFEQLQIGEPQETEKSRNRAVYLYLRFSIGDTSALDELKKMTEEESCRGDAYFFIGACYESAGRFLAAAEAYETSVQYRSAGNKITSIVSASRSLFNGGKADDAFSRIMHELSGNRDTSQLSQLYEGLAALYELAQEADLRAFALEKALEGRPNDTDLHFNAAWSYSSGEKQLSLLSLLHYRTLLRFEPDNVSALNNLGVQYHFVDLPLKSVRSYARAAELGETLAAANLAQLYMKAGFAKDASHILQDAAQKNDVHANVGRAISALAEKETAEEESAKDLLGRAREEQRFISRFSEAFFVEKSGLSLFEGKWRSDENGFELTISQVGNKVEGTLDLLIEQVTLVGNVNNRAAKCTLSKKSEYLLAQERGAGYLILSDNQLEMLTLRGLEHSVLVFTPSAHDVD